MEIETIAIITVAPKLDLLEKLLDRRIARAALDLTSPALPLLEKVYKLGEYKRLAANLAVMEHRLRCALGDEAMSVLAGVLVSAGKDWRRDKNVRIIMRRACATLADLGITGREMEEYKTLPLYRAECARLKRLSQRSVPRRKEVLDAINRLVGAAACEADRVCKTVRA